MVWTVVRWSSKRQRPPLLPPSNLAPYCGAVPPAHVRAHARSNSGAVPPPNVDTYRGTSEWWSLSCIPVFFG